MVVKKNIYIPSCYKQTGFDQIVEYTLHHSDASETEYVQASYLRMIDENGDVCCQSCTVHWGKPKCLAMVLCTFSEQSCRYAFRGLDVRSLEKTCRWFSGSWYLCSKDRD